MHSHMKNPATLTTCGAPNDDLAGCLIASESTKSLRLFQARGLARRCAISVAMAAILAPLLYGETVQ
ncbi:hypothetical protein CWO90_03180 [Bradyrhizobium sp. Leo121]|nr:hypothetical protein CWO90_03180 [Bradyrhizobium sp. Leo121]